MPTIFFVIRNPSRINFILRTSLFSILKSRGCRLVIISSLDEISQAMKEFVDNNIIFEPLHPMGRFSQMFSYWRDEATRINNPYINFGLYAHSYMRRRYTESSSIIKSIKKVIRTIVLKIIPKNIRQSGEFWDRIENMFIAKNCAENLFIKYKPNAVIVSTAGNEIPFLLACSKYSVPSVMVDSNIDAPQLRYYSQPRNITKWAVFGEPQKNEFMKMQNIPEDRLVITGALRYDYFFKDFKPTERTEFFKKIKADPDKKLITYAAKIPKMYPYNRDLIEIILSAIEENKFGPSQLFVRFDPGHDPFMYEDLFNKIIWEKADLGSDRSHVGNLLYHSDVVFSVGSTFCNEACLFNTPSIWVGFDGYHYCKTKEESSLIRYDLNVFKEIVSLGAIRLAKSKDELVNLIASYLKNPKLDSDNRRYMVEKYYYKTDGKAGERIAQLIESLIK